MIEIEQNGERAAVQAAQAAGGEFVEIDGFPSISRSTPC